MIKHEKNQVLFKHLFKSQHYISVCNFFIDERTMFEYNHFVTTHFTHLVWDLEKRKQKKIYLNVWRNKHGVVIPDAEVKDKDLSFILKLDLAALDAKTIKFQLKLAKLYHIKSFEQTDFSFQ